MISHTHSHSHTPRLPTIPSLVGESQFDPLSLLATLPSPFPETLSSIRDTPTNIEVCNIRKHCPECNPTIALTVSSIQNWAECEQLADHLFSSDLCHRANRTKSNQGHIQTYCMYVCTYILWRILDYGDLT